MPKSSSQRIENEAAHWAARLDGRGLNDADRAALAAWLEADAEHRWVLGRYRELSAQVTAQFEAETEAHELFAETRRLRRRLILAGLAAAAAVVLAVSFVAGRAREFVTRTAERHLAVLDDGSRIELNAQTRIEVRFARDARRVRLLRGEALFTVAKDTTRPFFVETPAGTVRVTGTVFNVRAGAEARVEVTVLEGNVRVTPHADAAVETTVASGGQALLAAGRVEVQTLAVAAAEDVVAWRQGQVVFDGVPLREAVERFAAYHARRIVVEPGAAGGRLGGRYSLDDLDGFLESIERVLGVRVRRESKGAVRISRAEPAAK